MFTTAAPDGQREIIAQREMDESPKINDRVILYDPEGNKEHDLGVLAIIRHDHPGGQEVECVSAPVIVNEPSKIITLQRGPLT